jgi:SSS family solute:Na+ symporter
MVLVWFLFGFGPFAVIGNTFFSDPNNPSTWTPFNLPSIWVWQIMFLLFGIFVMWFLAFYMGFSQPISAEKIEKSHKKYF